jgi:hypothetical protein
MLSISKIKPPTHIFRTKTKCLSRESKTSSQLNPNVLRAPPKHLIRLELSTAAALPAVLYFLCNVRRAEVCPASIGLLEGNTRAVGQIPSRGSMGGLTLISRSLLLIGSDRSIPFPNPYIYRHYQVTRCYRIGLEGNQLERVF